MDLRFAAVVAFGLVGCSGKTTAPKTIAEDARGSGSAHHGDAGTPPVTPGGKGDVQIRVEWKDVPAAARAAPGRTPCGTPRPPAVAPTTTWGIPDVVVALEPIPAGTTAVAPKRIVLEGCALSPRVVVATGSVALASATETPARVFVQRAGQLPLGGAITDDKPRPIQLPTAGHEVEIPVEPGSITRIVAGSEDAWIVASDSPYVAITEASGNVVLRGVPSGTHEVTAWLPARSGQPARVARGKVTVGASALAEVTLDITKQ